MNGWKDPFLTSVYLFVIAWFGLGFAGAIKVSMIVAFVLLLLISVPLMAYKGWIGCRITAFELNQLLNRYLINRKVISLRRIRIGLLAQRREQRRLERQSTYLEGADDGPQQSGDYMSDPARNSDHVLVSDARRDMHDNLPALDTHGRDLLAADSAQKG